MTNGLYFTKDHEWIKVADGVGTVGISDFAQSQLGDVVFVELPEAGRVLKAGDAVAVVESVKAASDVYCPVSGEILSFNEELPNDPALINSDAESTAWFFTIKLSDPSELDGLMTPDAYKTFLEEHA
ncbi:glycine cleavage system protein GcvH [Govanella unica]|uniref:Glycine cleavage system H protein n=1 Tax=Govanella unica TaxID=2975056 RepID=A0A9X3Z6R5_9PROT|nr:glycine cleavage system protein GcvH [Govania unica]MDA5193367.1 glycine cleavage system protein GcvH [Govania unica]